MHAGGIYLPSLVLLHAAGVLLPCVNMPTIAASLLNAAVRKTFAVSDDTSGSIATPAQTSSGADLCLADPWLIVHSEVIHHFNVCQQWLSMGKMPIAVQLT
jgi:hypothetical protein